MRQDRFQLMQQISRNTIMYRLHDWVDNFKANLKYIKGGYGVASFDGVLRAVPAMIVGAGPTLDRNIQYIQDAKNRACIFACDSVVTALLDYGVIPDLVLTTDSHAKCKDFFNGVKLSELNFVVDSFASPETTEMLVSEAKRVYWYNTLPIEDEPFTHVLNTWTGFIGNIGTGGCVATTIWSLAMQNMKAPMGILVGLTSGFYDPHHQYAYSVMKHNAGVLNPYPVQQHSDYDAFGNICYTVPAFKSFADWFQDAFVQIPALHINCSEGGIIKESCLTMPLKYCIDTYLGTEFDIEGILFEKEKKVDCMIRALGDDSLAKYRAMLTVLLDGPSVPNLALRMGIQPSAVIDAINQLREAGFDIEEGNVQTPNELGEMEDVLTFTLKGIRQDGVFRRDMC